LAQVLLPIDDGDSRRLPGPLDPALAETITPEAVAHAIGAVRALAPVVVLDTSSSFDDCTLAAIDVADVVVLVSSLDVAALRALTVSLQTLSRLGVDDDAVRVVLTRVDSRSGLHVADVERAIGRAVDVRIPSNRAVVRSVNEGVPLAVKSPRSGVVEAIDTLVEQLLDDVAPDLLVRSDDGGMFDWLPFVGRDDRAVQPDRRADGHDRGVPSAPPPAARGEHDDAANPESTSEPIDVGGQPDTEPTDEDEDRDVDGASPEPTPTQAGATDVAAHPGDEVAPRGTRRSLNDLPPPEPLSRRQNPPDEDRSRFGRRR
jgi:hypothetical protein